MDPRAQDPPPNSNPAGISDDWTSLILAIDYLLVLDNEEWSKKLAVLTREALYLLEPETGDPDPLMPFGRTWWRIAVKDIADVQYVAAERSLRICTAALVITAWLAATHRAATHRSRSPPACPRLPSGPRQRTLAASPSGAATALWHRPTGADAHRRWPSSTLQARR